VLKITFQTSTDVVLLNLEGSVAGPWVEELRKAWLKSAKMTHREPVNVDLGAVSFVDERGRDLLLRMRKEGVVLKGASSFLRYILEDAHGNSEQSNSNKDKRPK
jgi:anti-anti-sigma regulatory factor